MTFENREQALSTLTALEEALEARVVTIGKGFSDISALADNTINFVDVTDNANAQIFYNNAKLDKTLLTLTELDDLFQKINATMTALDGVTRVIDTYRNPEDGGEHITDLLAALAAGKLGSIAGVAAIGAAATFGAPVLVTFALGAVVGLGVSFIANAAFQDAADKLWLDEISQLTGENLGWAVYETAQAVSWLASTPAQTYDFLANLTGADHVGTMGDDTIEVYGNTNTFAVVGKNVFGLDGNDFIEGGTSKDTVFAGAGDDIIKSAALEIFGEDDDDYIEATNYLGTAYGGAGNDTLTGRSDMVGGAGEDTYLWADPDAELDAYVSYRGEGEYFVSSRLVSLTLSEVENIRLSDGTNLALISESVPGQLVDIGREDEVQWDPSQALLADGRVAMVWSDAWQGDGDTSNTQIRATIFNADMTEKSTEFRVNSTTQYHQNDAEVVALTTGGFVVVWTNVDSLLSNNSRTTTRYQVFDENGAMVGQERSVSGDTDYGQTEPHAAALRGGGFAIIWEDSDASGRVGDTNNDAIMAQRFNANGDATGSQFVVNSTYNGSQREPGVVQLSNGGFAVTWNFVEGYDGYRVASQAFDADGQKVGEERVVAREPGGFITPSSISALADGGYIVGWIASELGGYVAQKYTANGEPNGSLIEFGKDGNGYHTSILGLNDGRMVLTQDGHMGIYSADGVQESPWILNMVNPDSDGISEHMLQLPDGRVVVTQASDTDDWNGVYIDRSIVTQVLNIPGTEAFTLPPVEEVSANIVNGTDAAENVTGTSASEFLNAGAGGDWITPGAGSDTIDGGSGRDMLSFVSLTDTPGRSNVQYRLDLDLTTGRATTSGSDEYQISNVERVTGSIFADRIKGDANANELRGLGDYDWFTATTGADTIDGGTGQDMISYVDWLNTADNTADPFNDGGAPPPNSEVTGVVVDLNDTSNNTNLAAGHTYIDVERVTGSGRQDVFYGDDSENDFRGLGDYDWFVSSTGGRERYFGGDGIDTVTYYNASGGVSAGLSNGAMVAGEETGRGVLGDAALDLFFSIEGLVGTNFDDTLSGSAGRNNLSGLDGDDFIYGYGGIDQLKGGLGNDKIDGGGGSDYALYDGNRADFTVTKTSANEVTISGAEGTDQLVNVEYFRFADGDITIWDLSL